MRGADYDGVIVSGRSKKAVYLMVKDSDVEVRDAGHVWEKDGKQTVAALMSLKL